MTAPSEARKRGSGGGSPRKHDELTNRSFGPGYSVKALTELYQWPSLGVGQGRFETTFNGWLGHFRCHFKSLLTIVSAPFKACCTLFISHMGHLFGQCSKVD